MISKSASLPLELAELADPKLRGREVRVAVKAMGVNPVDWKMCASGMRLVQRALGAKGPLVPGIDFAGIVTEVGPLVEGVKVGDAVVGGTDFSRGQRGSYAEHVTVRDQQLAVVPAGVDLEAAACLPVAGVTAQAALFNVGGLVPNASPQAKVLVIGASGGVGHLAVQLAKRAGAEVFGVCSRANAELVTRLGATHLDYAQGDVLAEAERAGPFQVVVNAVGTERYPVSAVSRLLTATGRQVLVVPEARDFPYLVLPKVKTLVGRATRRSLEPLLAALAKRELEVVIAERIPLPEAQRAHELSRAGRVVGKLVLVA